MSACRFSVPKAGLEKLTTRVTECTRWRDTDRVVVIYTSNASALRALQLGVRRQERCFDLLLNLRTVFRRVTWCSIGPSVLLCTKVLGGRDHARSVDTLNVGALGAAKQAPARSSQTRAGYDYCYGQSSHLVHER